MEDMQDKLNAILSNPQMMSQIMSLAQTLQPGETVPQKEPAQSEPKLFGLDTGTMQNLLGFVQKTGIDKNQQTLLNALTPYMTKDRIRRLEKAMRAARLATAASSFLGSNPNSIFSGR